MGYFSQLDNTLRERGIVTPAVRYASHQDAVAAQTAPHLNHRVRWTYDCRGNGWPHCLECDVPVPTVTRTCPECSTEFDGTSIGATLEARILCMDCSAKRPVGDCR